MKSTSDLDLLRKFTCEHSQDAFTALVERHLNLVYCAGLRQVRSPLLAEEVAQSVFTDLAHKAARLKPDTILTAWLYEVTRRRAINVVRGEARRQLRERIAVEMNTMNANDDDWTQIEPLLDDAMHALDDTDRTAVLLRFFENKSLREVGETFGTTDDTARKRVNRAIERLREYFAKRGVTVGASGLVVVISANAVQAAPTVLAKSLTAVAFAKGAAGTGSTLTLIKGASEVLAWSKTKTAIIASLSVLFTLGSAIIVVREVRAHRTYPWQDMVDGGQMALKALDTTPPQVTIIRSKFPDEQPHRHFWADVGPIDHWRYIGTRASTIDLVRAAYEGDIPLPPLLDSEIIVPSDMPNGFYDFIANLPKGSREALAALVKAKFGLVGQREMRQMDVLLLEVDRPNAAGLNPGTSLTASERRRETRVVDGELRYQNQPISKLAARLEAQLAIPVIDRTGLTANYNFVIPESFGPSSNERIAAANQVLRNELGLKLVSNKQPHEVLVVSRVK